MKTLFGFVCTFIVVTALLCKCCYAQDLNIDIQSDVIEIYESAFENDVEIIIHPNIVVKNNSELKEIKYVIKNTNIIDINNTVHYITSGEEVFVVESHTDFTKIIFRDKYYLIKTDELGSKEEIDIEEVIFEESSVVYPLSNELPLSEELQKYIYDSCVKNGIKYCLFLGLCQQESDFGRYGTVNGNQFHVISKSGDYGMCQTNKKYVWPDVKKVFGWTDITVLFDPYKSVDAGIWEFSKCVNRYGNTEAAYDAYNRGLEHHGSTKNSRAVVKYWNYWKSKLGDI